MALIDIISQALGQQPGQTLGLPELQNGFTDYGPWGAGGGTPGPGPFPGIPGTTMDVPPATPYNPMLDPSNRGVFGFLGQLAGAPTKEEALAGRAGQYSSAAFKAFRQQVMNGVPPQKAVFNLLSSPEGVEWFSNPGSDPLADVKQWLTMIPQPADTQVVGQGAAVFDPNTGREVYRNPDVTTASPGQTVMRDGQPIGQIPYEPTNEAKNFEFYSQIAGLDETSRAAVARAGLATMMKGDVSEEKQVWDRLLAEGKVSRELYDAKIGNALQFIPAVNATGDVTGVIMVNPISGTAQFISNQGEGAVPLEQLPGAGDMPEADGLTPGSRVEDRPESGAALRGMADPTDIIMGAGWLPEVVQRGAAFVNPAFSGWGAAETKRNRSALAAIHKDALEFYNDSRNSAEERAVVGQLADTLYTSPEQAAQALISWNDILDNSINQAAMVLQSSQSKEQRARAEQIIQSARLAKANLPPREALVERLARLQGGETQFQYYGLDIGGVAERVKGQLEQAAGEASGIVDNALPPQAAIDLLRSEPSLKRRQQFDTVFGEGMADNILGTNAGPASRYVPGPTMSPSQGGPSVRGRLPVPPMQPSPGGPSARGPALRPRLPMTAPIPSAPIRPDVTKMMPRRTQADLDVGSQRPLNELLGQILSGGGGVPGGMQNVAPTVPMGQPYQEPATADRFITLRDVIDLLTRLGVLGGQGR